MEQDKREHHNVKRHAKERREKTAGNQRKLSCTGCYGQVWLPGQVLSRSLSLWMSLLSCCAHKASTHGSSQKGITPQHTGIAAHTRKHPKHHKACTFARQACCACSAQSIMHCMLDVQTRTPSTHITCTLRSDAPPKHACRHALADSSSHHTASAQF